MKHISQQTKTEQIESNIHFLDSRKFGQFGASGVYLKSVLRKKFNQQALVVVWAIPHPDCPSARSEVPPCGTCYCHFGKGMRKMEKELQPGCPFCGEGIELQIVAREGTVFAIRDKYPVTDLHTLVLPLRHVSDFFDLTPEEKADAGRALVFLRNAILKEDPSVTGFNVGVNCGVSAGQTIRHAHIHLIPRREEDIPNPRGGVRGVIPAKMDYPT